MRRFEVLTESTLRGSFRKDEWANDKHNNQLADDGNIHTALGFPDSGSGTPSLPAEPGTATSAPGGEPTELLVQFGPGVNAAAIAAAASAIGGSVVETIHTPAMALSGEGVLVRVTIGAEVPLDQAIQVVGQRPGVVFAEPNWGISVEATSNDPGYTGGKLWGMYGDTTTPTNQYGSQSGEAWALDYTGSYEVVTGVVDTGIDYTHPDLYLNIWLNQNEIPSELKTVLTDANSDGLITFWDLNAEINSSWVTDSNKTGYIDAGDLLVDRSWADRLDNDSNGYVDDLIGWDFVNNDNDPYDDHGHGTHVAGTIGAMGGNGTGVAGVAWNAQLVPLKFLSSSGSGTTSGAIQALDYYTYASAITPAQDFVATNNSWGGGDFSQGLLDSIVRGAKQDILFIAAAGNGGWDGKGDDNDSTAHYPSNYDTTAGAGFDAVIAVASLTDTGALSSFSNYGANTVDLGAPGQSIYSTLPGGYGTYSGTSMATPHIAGAVALYAAATGAGAADIKQALLSSTTPTASLSGKTVTGGRLNVGDLMEGAAAPAPEPGDTTPPAAPLLVGITDDTGVSETDGITRDQELIISGTAEPGSIVEVFRDHTSIGTTTADGSGNWSIDHAGTSLSSGNYSFSATATDAAQNTSVTSEALLVTIDIDAPVAPSELDLVESSDTGSSSTDDLTSDTTPTITGTAEPGAEVELQDGSGAVLGTATADANGLWSITTSPLADGTYSLMAMATDLAGNMSAASTALTVVIDTTEQTSPNYVYGTDGSDPSVQGTTGDDTISGLAENSTSLGSGTIDTLIGDDGNDSFVLGDSRGAYYDDGNKRSIGTSDYALITDFSSGDAIQLNGSAANYLMSASTVDGESGMGIYIDGNGNRKLGPQDELVGLVQGPDSGALDLNSTQFSFVTSDPLV